MIDGVARQVGSAPNEFDPFAVGDLEIYRVDPPLCGYRIIAASKSMWAMRPNVSVPMALSVGRPTTQCRRRYMAWSMRGCRST
jgi:hypothetical protein